MTGNLGHGDLERRLVPTRVDSLASSYSVESVSCGAYHTAAIATEIADSESDNDTDRGRRDSVHVDLTGDNELFADESTRGIGSSSKRVVLLTWYVLVQMGTNISTDYIIFCLYGVISTIFLFAGAGVTAANLDMEISRMSRHLS